mmetsp:Transcript_15823/g.53708  ORF Transcript_15823/g.53708 Transcript_15823/m.53708 type:complete len:250 (-) Transcript_15823:16-765(-)
MAVLEGSGLSSGIWSAMGSSTMQLFGRETAVVALWTACALALRLVLVVLGVVNWVPPALVFSTPIFVERFLRRLPFADGTFPNLAVRVAEGALGRLRPKTLAAVMAAHLIGAVMGCALLRLLVPVAPEGLLAPVAYPTPASAPLTLLLEGVYTFAYSLLVVVLPELLAVNGVRGEALTLVLFPLMLLGTPGKASTLSPSVLYALWFCSRGTAWAARLPAERIAGQLLGAAAAGLVCARAFPDDPRTRRR